MSNSNNNYKPSKIFVPIRINRIVGQGPGAHALVGYIPNYGVETLVRRLGNDNAKKVLKKAHRRVNSILNNAIPNALRHNGYATNAENNSLRMYLIPNTYRSYRRYGSLTTPAGSQPSMMTARNKLHVLFIESQLFTGVCSFSHP